MAKYLVVSLLVELDGGEALDLGVLQLVDRRVHLGNDDRFVVLEFLAELVVDGRQLFAMSAPECRQQSERAPTVTLVKSHQGA